MTYYSQTPQLDGLGSKIASFDFLELIRKFKTFVWWVLLLVVCICHMALTTWVNSLELFVWFPGLQHVREKRAKGSRLR